MIEEKKEEKTEKVEKSEEPKKEEAPKEEEKKEESKKEETQKQEEKKEEPKKEEVAPTGGQTPKAEEKKEEAPKKETPKAEAKPEASKKEEKKPEPKKEITGPHKKLIETIKDMSVIELSELVKELEDVFGVSAAAPVVVAAGGAGVGSDGGEEKTSFNVVLTAAGDKKIQVIKEVRTLTSLGLKEAKALVDSAPKPIKEGVEKEEAEKIKGQLEGAGATVELQ